MEKDAGSLIYIPYYEGDLILDFSKSVESYQLRLTGFECYGKWR